MPASADLDGPERLVAARGDDVARRRLVAAAHLALQACVQHFFEHERAGVRARCRRCPPQPGRARRTLRRTASRDRFCISPAKVCAQHAVGLVEQPQLGFLVARAESHAVLRQHDDAALDRETGIRRRPRAGAGGGCWSRGQSSLARRSRRRCGAGAGCSALDASKPRAPAWSQHISVEIRRRPRMQNPARQVAVGVRMPRSSSRHDPCQQNTAATEHPREIAVAMPALMDVSPILGGSTTRSARP